MIVANLLSLLLFVGQVSSRTYDLINGGPVSHSWMETGWEPLDDITWVTVNSLGQSFVNPIILTALPDLGGDTYTEGISTATRVRNVVNEGGQVSFEMKLFQPNDTYCSKEWYTPEYINPAVKVGWAIVEYGAYNISNYTFIVGTGVANRTHDDLGAHHDEFHQLMYPTGCYGDNVNPCQMPYDRTTLGAIATIQSYVHQEYLLLRVQDLYKRFLRIVVTPHDSTDPSYFERFATVETIGYMVFPTGVFLDCVERVSFETTRWDDVTSTKLYYAYHFEYTLTPNVFGLIITQNSLVDSTALRVFDRSLTDAYVITQEDYCDGSDPKHTTDESASALVIGETNGGTIICDIGYYPPTPAPSPPPTNDPCTYHFLLYDLFGDGWQNINLTIDTDGKVTNYQVQCACDMITVVSNSCVLTLQMTADGEPIAPWEVLFASNIGGQTWVGDYDTIMHIDHEVVTLENGPDVDPDSLENKCRACTPADDDEPTPQPNPGPNPPNPNPRPRPNRGGDDRPNRRSRVPTDDNKAPGAGKGKSGDDKGRGKGPCKDEDGDGKCDDDKKRKLCANGFGYDCNDNQQHDDANHDDHEHDDHQHGNGVAPFSLFDQFGNGWYKGCDTSSGVCDSELCPNNDDTCVEETVDLPDILTYPKWYIMNPARTELIDFGTFCDNPGGIDKCGIALPDGRYIFRVAGFNLDGDVASWRFCGIYGVNHQELQFSMENGHCVPQALLAAEDYCTGFKTLMTIYGTLPIYGVTDANIDDYDTNAIYLQLLCMFPNVVGVEILSETLSGTTLTVNYKVIMSPEDYGLDGSFAANIDTCLGSIYAYAQNQLQTSFLSGLSTTILASPSGEKDALAHVTGATLTSLEIVSIQYVKKDDNTVLHPLDVITTSSSSKGEMVHNGVSVMTVVALVCGAIFMAAATAFVVLRSRVTSTHSPLSDKSSHLDTSVNGVSPGTSLDIEK